MKETNEYTKQAEDFLKKFGIKFRATLSDSKTPPWKSGSDDFGRHFRVTLSKGRRGQGVKFGQRVVFDFWSSVADKKLGKFTVEPYDVLACISGDATCEDSFEEWCASSDESTDSLRALQTFRRCSKFGKRLRAFFSAEELAALSQIQ